MLRMEPCCFPSARAMSLNDCARFRRSQSSFSCAAEKPRRRIVAFAVVATTRSDGHPGCGPIVGSELSGRRVDLVASPDRHARVERLDRHSADAQLAPMRAPLIVRHESRVEVLPSGLARPRSSEELSPRTLRGRSPNTMQLHVRTIRQRSVAFERPSRRRHVSFKHRARFR